MILTDDMPMEMLTAIFRELLHAVGFKELVKVRTTCSKWHE
jgi:hypothetical protein